MKKIIMPCILIILLISVSTVSAVQNITDAQESDDISESIVLEKVVSDNSPDEILNMENNTPLEAKKNPQIDIRNTESVYGSPSFYVIIQTPKINTKNIDFYLDGEKTNLGIYEYSPSDVIEFFIDPETLSIGEHTIKVDFKGDDNYQAQTITRTITRSAFFYCSYNNQNHIGTCMLELPEDAKGNLTLHIDGEKYGQTGLTNGSGELTFKLKPGTYNATIQYEGDDYPVKDITNTLDVRPEININGTKDSIEINIVFYENAEGNFTIADKNTNQTLSEVPLTNGKATVKLDHLTFENNFIATYKGNDYNYTNPYVTYSWGPDIIKNYCIGPGSYIEFDLGKNTSGTFRIENYECIDSGWHEIWNHTKRLGEINYTNGSARIYLPSLSGGFYTFYVNILDEEYGNWSTFLYANVKPTISIPTVIYNMGEIDFELYKANGTLEIYIDDAIYTTKEIVNGKAKINLTGLSYGKHSLKLTFNGKAEDRQFYDALTTEHPKYDYPYDYSPTYMNYYEDFEEITEIFYAGPVSVMTENVIVGNPVLINIKAEDNVKDAVITVSNNTYVLNSSELNITLTDLKIGEYNITISYIENNTTHCITRSFNVEPANETFAELEKLIKKTPEYGTLKLNKDYINNGFEKEIIISKSITIEGDGHIIDANNTSRAFNIISYYSHESIDVIFKNIIFKNGNSKKGGAIYANCQDYTISSIYWEITNCTFEKCNADNGGAIYGWGNCKILNSTFSKCSAKQGGAIWSVDDSWRMVNTTFEKCSANIGGAIYFKGENSRLLNCRFKGNTASQYPNWYSPYPIITTVTASNMKATYSAGQYYSIKIYNTNGKLADGVKVIVKINGKSFKTLTTINGVAKFKITQTPGTYKLTITALDNTVTKTLIVKHIVTLKTVKVKKSAQKLTLQANLGKANGKYLKNKQVTFKFNGKTYKAKTDSKGIAKYPIKQSALNNLKVGKTITYHATYQKDTVKKTVKVQK